MEKFYENVDLTDLIVDLYGFDQKSKKWWKKVFYKLLMMAARNNARRTKTSFLPFLIIIVEDLIALEKRGANVKWKICNIVMANLAEEE